LTNSGGDEGVNLICVVKVRSVVSRIGGETTSQRYATGYHGRGCHGRPKGSAEGHEACPPDAATTSKAEGGVCNLLELRYGRCVSRPRRAAYRVRLAQWTPKLYVPTKIA
jgi:hypothetical protein